MIEFLVNTDQSLLLVEDGYFQAFCRTLNPEYPVFGADTARRMILDLFSVEKAKIMAMLQVCVNNRATDNCFHILTSDYSLTHTQATPGRISLMIDTWTSPNELNFLSVIASFVKDGVLCSDLISFQELPAYHDGFMLGETLFEILEDYGITAKVEGLVGIYAKSKKILTVTV